jgi:hypothetical protein
LFINLFRTGRDNVGFKNDTENEAIQALEKKLKSEIDAHR